MGVVKRARRGGALKMGLKGWAGIRHEGGGRVPGRGTTGAERHGQHLVMASYPILLNQQRASRGEVPGILVGPMWKMKLAPWTKRSYGRFQNRRMKQPELRQEQRHASSANAEILLKQERDTTAPLSRHPGAHTST